MFTAFRTNCNFKFSNYIYFILYCHYYLHSFFQIINSYELLLLLLTFAAWIVVCIWKIPFPSEFLVSIQIFFRFCTTKKKFYPTRRNIFSGFWEFILGEVITNTHTRILVVVKILTPALLVFHKKKKNPKQKKSPPPREWVNTHTEQTAMLLVDSHKRAFYKLIYK